MRDLRCKEVINICDGCRLGFVADVDVKIPDGQVCAIIVYGPCRFFGLFGRGEEFYIPWECIQRIGDDIILIDKPFQRRDPNLERKRRRGLARVRDVDDHSCLRRPLPSASRLPARRDGRRLRM